MTATTSGRSGLDRASWRTIEIVVAAMVGVVFGVVYWGWDQADTVLDPVFKGVLGPSVGLLGGPWLLAGVVASFVVRRPGAALLAELLAATVEALLGNQWGATTLISGAFQGLGVELALVIFFYRWFSWPVAAIGGALAALFEFGYEWNAYWQGYAMGWKFAYLGFFMLSGAVIAGVGGWLLVRALAATGAVDALAAGKESAADHAI